MGKEKPLNYETAKTQLATVKESLSAKRTELTDWLKEKKLKKSEDHSKNENEKIAKKFTRLTAETKDLETKREELKKFVAENKPSKDRVTKYAYPDGATSDDKKKFRQNCRAAAKAAKVDLATYLGDVAKYEKVAADARAARAAKSEEKVAKKEKKTEGETVAKKKPKVEAAEEAPAKKKKKAAVESAD